jgi:hypothetical protein
VHQNLAVGRKMPRPQQIVGVGPVVVLAVYVQQVDRAIPVRPQFGAVTDNQLNDVGQAGRADIGFEPFPGGRTAEQPAVDKRVDGHHTSADNPCRYAEDGG